MSPDQLAFSFGAPVAPKLGQADTGQTPLQLRDEIARVWGLPLDQHVEITFRPAFPVPAVGGLLELRADPARYPWDPHEPLALRVAGCDFSSRDIERWKVI